MTQVTNGVAAGSLGWCDWGVEEVVLVAGVVASVAAVAAALFAGEIFTAIGFALFGAAALWMLVNESGDVEQIRQMETQLSAGNQRVEQLTQAIGAERIAFQGELQQMQVQVAQFQGANQQLEALRQQWEGERGVLQQRTQALEEQRGALQGQVAALEQTVVEVRGQAGQFSEQNQALRQHVEALQAAAAVLPDREAGLRGAIEVLDGRFDQNMDGLEAALQARSEAWRVVAETIGAQSQTLREIIQRLGALEGGIARQIAGIAAEREGLEATRARIQRMVDSLSEQRRLLAEESERIRARWEELQAFRAEALAAVESARGVLHRRRDSHG